MRSPNRRLQPGGDELAEESHHIESRRFAASVGAHQNLKRPKGLADVSQATVSQGLDPPDHGTSKDRPVYRACPNALTLLQAKG